MILKTYARLFVRSLDDALPFLETLAGRPADLRFRSDDPKLLHSILDDVNHPLRGPGEVEQAAVGEFLVIAGDQEALDIARKVAGPIIIDDLRKTMEDLINVGAVVIVPPTAVETGMFSYVRHPGGELVEYVEWKPELLSRIIG